MSFDHAFLFLKPTPEAEAFAERVEALLEAKNLPSTRITDTLPDAQNPIAFVLGGDGTFLRATHTLYGTDIPICGINLGHLGFLTEVDQTDIETSLDKLLADHAPTESRPYYLCTVKDAHENVVEQNMPFMNDIVLQRETANKMIQFAANTEHRFITSVRADGVIISTPTGSTAYNLSVSGPILHPDVEALILAPICPHTLSFRPIVLPPQKVRLELESDEGGLLSLDGCDPIVITKGMIIEVALSSEKITLRHAEPRDFFNLLRHKLRWDGKYI